MRVERVLRSQKGNEVNFLVCTFSFLTKLLKTVQRVMRVELQSEEVNFLVSYYPDPLSAHPW